MESLIQGSALSAPTPPRRDQREHFIVCTGEVTFTGPEGADSQQIEERVCRKTAGDEQPYRRKMRNVGQNWTPLDKGWYSEAGLLVIQNLENRDLQVNPELEEQARIDKRIIEVGVWLDPTYLRFAVIRPGEDLRFEPCELRSLVIRCRFETANVMVHIFTK